MLAHLPCRSQCSVRSCEPHVSLPPRWRGRKPHMWRGAAGGGGRRSTTGGGRAHAGRCDPRVVDRTEAAFTPRLPFSTRSPPPPNSLILSEVSREGNPSTHTIFILGLSLSFFYCIVSGWVAQPDGFRCRSDHGHFWHGRIPPPGSGVILRRHHRGQLSGNLARPSTHPAQRAGGIVAK